MVNSSGVDAARVERLSAAENERFVAERPVSTARLERARRTMPRGVPMSWMEDLYEHPPAWITHGEGARFWDVDGHEYLDLYIADMSAFCGHGPGPVVAAVAERMRLGNQFLQPGEDAIPLAEHLAERYGMPKWQFTLSATQANTEVIRIARHATEREIVVVFEGKYHGHVDATMVVLGDGALVLTEPAITNSGFLLPKAGFQDAMRHLTAEAGTLLAVDETHTLVTAYAGLGRLWGLEPDFLTLGKSIAAGVPLATYGMTDAVAQHLAAPDESYVVSGAVTGELATGGTLFANALSLAAARAALTEVLTPEAFARAGVLGARLADGVRAAIAAHNMPWSVTHEGSHAYYTFAPDPPHDNASAQAADDPDLRGLMRVFMANRGVWESGWWLGPTVSVAHTEDDVDSYLAVFDDFLTVATS